MFKTVSTVSSFTKSDNVCVYVRLYVCVSVHVSVGTCLFFVDRKDRILSRVSRSINYFMLS